MESLYGSEQLQNAYRQVFFAADEPLLGAFLATVIAASVYEDLDLKTDFRALLGGLPEIDFSEEQPDALWVTDAGLLQVGSGILMQLDEHALVFADYLLWNFLQQMAPPWGAPPGPQAYGAPGQVSKAALTLYSASRLPANVTRDGYVKRQGQTLLEALSHYHFDPVEKDSPPPGASGMLYRPPMPPDEYDRQEVYEGIPQRLADDASAPYLLRLHQQLLLDTLYFLFAHELSHLACGHHTYNPDHKQSRQEEVDADRSALEAMLNIDQFNLRSLLMVFGYIHNQETDDLQPGVAADGDPSHPFSRDRLSLLCSAALLQQDDDLLVSDLNTSLALLESPEFVFMPSFGGAFNEEAELLVRSHPSLDYAARLDIGLTRSPPHRDKDKLFRENQMLLQSMTFNLRLVLRDRTHPKKIHRRASIAARTGVYPENPWFAFRDDGSVDYRISLTLPLLPEWWLNYPEGVVDIEDITITSDEIPGAEDSEKLVIDYRNLQTSFDHPAFLAQKQDQTKDPETGRTMLLAARQYAYSGLDANATLYYLWVYRYQRHRLRYGDWIDLCHALNRTQQWGFVEQVFNAAGQHLEHMRPGFNFEYALASSLQHKYHRALKHAFLELVGVGEKSEQNDLAEELYLRLIAWEGMQGGSELMDYHAMADLAQQQANDGELERAIETWRSARELLASAGRLEDKEDSIVWRQYHAEAGASIVRLCHALPGGPDAGCRALSETVKAEYRDIARDYPDFVPPLTELAKLALLEGDREGAHRLWQQAHEMMPLHNFVYDLRYAVEDMNPDSIARVGRV